MGARHSCLFAGARGAGRNAVIHQDSHRLRPGHFRVDTFQQAGSLLQHSACLVCAAGHCLQEAL